MKNKDGIVVWDENVILSNHGDMTKADVDRVRKGISGHSHIIHRSLFVKDEFKVYPYLFDTMQNLGFCDKEVMDWESRLDIMQTLQSTCVGATHNVDIQYNIKPTAWGKDDA